MATQIVITNGDMINLDDGSYLIEWIDKGNAMPALPSTVHAVIWNNLTGQNEIQNKDSSTGDMTGNTNLSSSSDSIGSTTVAALLSWAETRKAQIEQAKIDHDTAEEAALTAWLNADVTPSNTHENFSWTKTWIDYDSNYS